MTAAPTQPAEPEIHINDVDPFDPSTWRPITIWWEVERQWVLIDPMDWRYETLIIEPLKYNARSRGQTSSFREADRSEAVTPLVEEEGVKGEGEKEGEKAAALTIPQETRHVRQGSGSRLA